MIPGMAYFVRRLLENTSNQSWLRAGFSDEVSDDVLLASPHAPPRPNRPSDGVRAGHSQCPVAIAATHRRRRPPGGTISRRPSRDSATACR